MRTCTAILNAAATIYRFDSPHKASVFAMRLVHVYEIHYLLSGAAVENETLAWLRVRNLLHLLR
jgi:hypothetical protein